MPGHSLPDRTIVGPGCSAPGEIMFRPQDLGVGLPFYAHTVTSPDASVRPIPSGRRRHHDRWQLLSRIQGRSLGFRARVLRNSACNLRTIAACRHILSGNSARICHPTNPNSLLRAAFLKNQTSSGDFDGDHDVDAADYAFGERLSARRLTCERDGNGNGIVDAADYVVWRKHALGAGSGTTLNAVVPEPATCVVDRGLLVWFWLSAADDRAAEIDRRLWRT